MTWIAIATPPFTSIETFDAVHSRFGDEPAGLEARYVGSVDGELRVVMVWASKAARRPLLRPHARPGPGRSARPRAGRRSHGCRLRRRTQLPP